jgi:integrase
MPEPVRTAPAGPWGKLLEEFASYLVSERGLAEQTVVGYRCVAASFLSTCPCEGNGDSLAGLTPVEVNTFLLAECARRSIGSVNNVVVALRALLRFLYVHGHIAAPLADAVPWVATWRDGGRSRALTASQVVALLASCDRRGAAGRRDFAILTVLARLGLRAGEVASLTLDDFDWRAGEVVVAGKGNRRDRLPLPTDVGEAVAGYCRRGRPRNSCREVFLHMRAPYTAMSPSAVSHVVLRASWRAGIVPVRAHQLRYSTASAMRRAGAPLFEIGQVLRHNHAVTTAVYAKDDLEALAGIARPWPGERS